MYLNTDCIVRLPSLDDLFEKYGELPEYWQKLDVTTEEMYRVLASHEWIVRDIMAPAEQTLLPEDVGWTALIQDETGGNPLSERGNPYIVPCDDLFFVRSGANHTYQPGDIVMLRDYDRYSYRAYKYWGMDEDEVRSLRRANRNQFTLVNTFGGANGILMYRLANAQENFTVPAFLCMGKDAAQEYIDRSTRRSCERCGASYSESSEVHDALHPEDRNLCPSCRERRFVTPYHHYQPHFEFHKKAHDDNLFLGVELEVDVGGQRDAEAAVIMDIMNKNEDGFMVYCSRDGSLNNGIEIITAPATLNYHKKLKTKYKALFKRLIRDGYRSHNTNTCGIHVHFSRAFFEDNEDECVTKLLYLVERFWDEIVVFSRRDYSQLDHFAKKPESDSKRFLRSWNKTHDHEGRYYAVNITNENTIELRMFRGTLNFESFMAILDFTDKLARVCKEKTNEELQSMSFEDLLTPEAKAYYDSRVAIRRYDEV